MGYRACIALANCISVKKNTRSLEIASESDQKHFPSCNFPPQLLADGAKRTFWPICERVFDCCILPRPFNYNYPGPILFLGVTRKYSEKGCIFSEKVPRYTSLNQFLRQFFNSFINQKRLSIYLFQCFKKWGHYCQSN